MREIIFRGKRIDNGEWVYGDLTRYSEEMSYITVDLLEHEIHQVRTETVGQYTGLQDRKESGIYEGDIVRGGNIAHEKYLVVDIFGTTYSLYQTNPARQKLRKPYCRLDSRVICDDFSSIETNLEIIGNIHDVEVRHD